MMKVESHSVYVGQFCILDVGKCMRVFLLFFFVCLLGCVYGSLSACFDFFFVLFVLNIS